MNISTWAAEDIEKLRRLAESGLTSTEIAAEFPNKSRNSIMGKIHRTGIKLNSAAAEMSRKRAATKTVTPFNCKKNRKPAPKIAKKMPRWVAEAIYKSELQAIVMPLETKKIMELGNYECRCIVGKVDGANTRYCAAPVKQSSSYCPEHHAKFYLEKRRN
jgi:hypothetical protein